MIFKMKISSSFPGQNSRREAYTKLHTSLRRADMGYLAALLKECVEGAVGHADQIQADPIQIPRLGKSKKIHKESITPKGM